MVKLSIEDIIQQYGNTVILYKGKPSKVKNVGKEIKLFDLTTQRNKMVEFSFKDFSPPQLRLGFVNIDETAMYVARRPVRMMKTGIDKNNCTIQHCNTNFAQSLGAIQKKVYEMECYEFSDMMLGHYPTFDKAYKLAQQYNGCFAFDKQFAIDYENFIFYKGSYAVGTYSNKNKNIVWNKGKEYLQMLIGNEYVKTVRTS